MRSHAFFVIAMMTTCLHGQQVADSSFIPYFEHPAHPLGAGPVVTIDEAHHNFHTRLGRYMGATRVLEAEGYRVTSNTASFSRDGLAGIGVLIIANPINAVNAHEWVVPTPSAFEPGEIAALGSWVRDGGRLLLIVDHMPFAGAAHDLARTFGFTFINCFALDQRRRPLDTFHRGAGLADHPITHGVDTVVTFTGSAFQAPPDAEPIIVLDENVRLLEPDTAWQFHDGTSSRSGAGWYQGAALRYGRGRVVVMGEAAMFSAQLAGPDRQTVGMNHPRAQGNIQLLRNLMAWLTQ